MRTQVARRGLYDFIEAVPTAMCRPRVFPTLVGGARVAAGSNNFSALFN